MQQALKYKTMLHCHTNISEHSWSVSDILIMYVGPMYDSSKLVWIYNNEFYIIQS